MSHSQRVALCTGAGQQFYCLHLCPRILPLLACLLRGEVLCTQATMHLLPLMCVPSPQPPYVITVLWCFANIYCSVLGQGRYHGTGTQTVCLLPLQAVLSAAQVAVEWSTCLCQGCSKRAACQFPGAGTAGIRAVDVCASVCLHSLVLFCSSHSHFGGSTMWAFTAAHTGFHTVAPNPGSALQGSSVSLLDGSSISPGV